MRGCRNPAKGVLHVDGRRIFVKSLRNGERLSQEDEYALIAQAHSGDIEARNAVIENHLPFVINRATALCVGRSCIEDMDLVQVGVVTLIRCLEPGRFDCERGVKFLTYAGPSISREMRRYINTRTTIVTVPDYTHPSAKNHLTPETIDRWRRFACLYIEDVRSPSGGVMPVDEMRGQSVVAPYHEDEVPVELMRECINKLPPRERKVLSMRMDGDVLKDIGKSMGITKERVRQLQFRAMKTMRRLLLEQNYDPVDMTYGKINEDRNEP